MPKRLNPAAVAGLDQAIAAINDDMEAIVRNTRAARDRVSDEQLVADLAVTLNATYEPLDVAALAAVAIARLARMEAGGDRR